MKAKIIRLVILFEHWWNSHVYDCKHDVVYEPENDWFRCKLCSRKFKKGSFLYNIAYPLLKMSDKIMENKDE